MKKWTGLLYSTGIALALVACTEGNNVEHLVTQLDEVTPLKSVANHRKPNMEVVAAVDLIKRGEHKKASTLINLRLQEDPANTAMHILNGINYELMAEHGSDASRLDLAVVGYQTALNIDPNNQLALQRLANLRFKKKEFAEAQELYANALLLTPDDPKLLQELAAASYYAYDLKTAAATIKRAVELAPDEVLAQRSATMIYAALGDFETSDQHFATYKGLVGEDPDVHLVAGRLGDWKGLYNSGRIHLAQADDDNFNPFQSADDTSTGSPEVQNLADQVLKSPQTSSGGGDSSSSSKSTSPSNKQQIIIDCYLLRIGETVGTTKGTNILDGLNVTLNPGGYLFGRTTMSGSGVVGQAGNTVGLLPNQGDTNNAADQPLATSINLNSKGSARFTAFAAGLSWSGLNYNLNIANVADNRTEGVARPALHTFVGHESVFFSGTELVLGLVGNEGGNIVNYPVGVTLVITPTEYNDDAGTVTLNISVQGAEFDTPNVTQDLRTTVRVGKTRIDTRAKVKLGQTLALGGIYEREETFSKSGFPGLSDVPVLQYFFSTESNTAERNSVVILMTPRSPEKMEHDIAVAMKEDRIAPNLAEFERRNQNWFDTSPNLAKVFSYMSFDPIIYKEFRSVDVLPPSWGDPDSFMRDGLAMFASFIYY